MEDDRRTERNAQAEDESSNDQQHDLRSFVRRTMLLNVKSVVEKFDGTNNFGMWYVEV